MARLKASPTYADDLDGSPDEAHVPRAESMERVLEVLDEHHGGPLGWLEEHGFGADEPPRCAPASPPPPRRASRRAAP